MQKTNKVQQYLKSQGVDESTPKDQVQELKEAYWKKERVLLNKSYRDSRKDIRFSLSISDWKQIERTAKSKNMTVTEYARKTLKSEHEGVYLSPNIPQIDKLKKLVNNIASNINSTVQFMHLTRNYGESDSGLGRLKKELNLLFRMLQESIEDKPELYRWLQDDLEKHPDRIDRVKHIIEKIENNASR